MMGRHHAASGVPAGMAVAPLVGLEHSLMAIPFTVTVSGSALLPDLDHPSASGARALGTAGAVISKILRRSSVVVYERTKGPADEDWNGKHRHLSHTWIFALGLGGVVAGLGAITPWAMLPVYMLTLLLADDRLGKWAMLAGLTGGMLAVPELLDGNTAMTWQLGVAVALGCMVHDLGDALTVGGCPFGWLPWPLGKFTTWSGETWFEIRLLGPLSFRTNSWVENTLIPPLLLGLTVLTAVPYGQPWIGIALDQTITQITA